MNLLSRKEEDMLSVILSKYNNNSSLEVTGMHTDFQEYMRFCIKETMENLKLFGYIANYNFFISGDWIVNLTPDGISYFEKKGMREKLFNELPENAKDLLKQIIDNEEKNISDLLAKKVEEDKTDAIVRGIIGTLKENGLINVNWASNNVYHAELTNAGRTYFEREERYKKQLEMSRQIAYNIGTINANGSNFVIGNAINSNFNLESSFNNVEKEIEEKGGEDKEELHDLLQETKEIIENFENSKIVQTRKSFINRLSKHLEKHSWFYGAITTILGETFIKVLSGN